MQEKKIERAKIFMPFAALKGFEEALREKEKIVVKKRELNEEEMEKLNKKMAQIQKGQMIKLVYFDRNEYIEKQGLVSQIDKILGYITIVNEKIKFEDIFDLEILKNT